MATEPTLIRRYTPPTCSLEIAAQQSPLSRWMGKVALKDLRFKLSFDDPRISDDDWVVLRGDRIQLEELNQAVGDYVQSFLTQSSPVGTIEQDIAAQTAVAAAEIAAPTNTTGIALQPKGLLSHTLSLGSLATENSGERLILTSTQLADLSTALDEYSAEAITLPNLDRKVAWLPNTSQWSSPNWAGLAAGILVTVGLGASLMNGLSNRSATPTTASSSDQRLAMQPPPTPAAPTPNPFLVPPMGKLPTGSPLPSPGAPNAPLKIATATPGSNPDQKIGTMNAPTIANTQGGQSEIKIVPPPKPSLSQAQSDAAPKQAPVPPIVDQIGSDPEPTKPSAAANSAEARMEGADRAAALGKLSSPPAPMARSAPLPALAPSVVTSDQVRAVQSYFQQSWKPQKGLEQGLQYELQLDGSGALQSVTPLGGTSTDQQSKAGIPAIGTPIAPAASDGKSTTVRLLLEPSGGVQAF
jgi:Domain of unknown function (DUF4335)